MTRGGDVLNLSRSHNRLEVPAEVRFSKAPKVFVIITLLLIHLYLKTEKCKRLKVVAKREPLFILKNHYCNRKPVPEFAWHYWVPGLLKTLLLRDDHSVD